MPPHLLTPNELRLHLGVRDLTDPGDGPHAIQLLVDRAVDALQTAWQCEVRWVRTGPIVSVADNYDNLEISADAISREARYSRYVSHDVMLRSHSTAMIPNALRELALSPSDDVLLACPGIVYRRDAIDRLHTGTPHQLDLWRVRRGKPLGVDDLVAMIRQIVAVLTPGRPHREITRRHSYTTHGRQVDVLANGKWVEVCECGLGHAVVLRRFRPSGL